MKRNDYISWDQYFMGIAMLSAQRSKDPNTQVGACIVGPDNRILSVGYNGMPQGCEDDSMPWGREGAALESKYLFVCHAELNAILNYRGARNFKDARLYVTLFPCNECAKAVIQTGIKEVVYLDNKYKDTVGIQASKKMLELAGVKLRHFEGTEVDTEQVAHGVNLSPGGLEFFGELLPRLARASHHCKSHQQDCKKLVCFH